MPSTIVVGNDDDATRYPQQSKVFRNPRGLKYYYAVITTSTGIHLYKSQNGTTWTHVTTFSTEHEFIGSVELYDTGSELIVYLTYGQSTTYIWYDPIYYRRLVIADDASDPVVGAEQVAVASDVQGNPVIRIDRNGYVHIAFIRNRDVSIKGVTYMKSETWLVGTTSTYPTDSPSWCTPVRVEAHPDTTSHTRHAKCSLTVFSGTGDSNTNQTFYTSRSDGQLRGREPSFKGAREKPIADYLLDNFAYFMVGVNHTKALGYMVSRGFLYFDTSVLGGAVIGSATLRFHPREITTTFEDFSIHVQNGMPVNPHVPMEVADYNMLHYSGDGGSVSTVGKVACEWLEIPLNEQGIGWINKTGITKLALRTNHDVNGIAPKRDSSANTAIDAFESGNTPELIVTLEAPDIGGVIYAINEVVNTTEYGRLKGCDIVSFNGTSYSLGTPTIIDTIPRVGYMNASQFDLYEGFKVVTDSDAYAHVLYRTEVTNERLRHRKASVSETVESWEAYNVVDDTNTWVFTMGLVLTIDKSVTPNDLYAFYIFRFYENTRVRWRKTPVDTISWSDETTISDDTNRIVDIGAWIRDVEGSLHIIYSYFDSPYTTRYLEFTIAVPIPPPKYSFTIPIQYVTMTTLIKRNGKIVAYRTPYTPYGDERPIQPQVVG